MLIKIAVKSCENNTYCLLKEDGEKHKHLEKHIHYFLGKPHPLLIEKHVENQFRCLKSRDNI